MTFFLKTIAVSTLLLLPIAASAQTLTCPEPEAVLADEGGTEPPLSITEMSEMIGKAELDGKDMHKAADSLRIDFPKASDAEIADLMITAYCKYLRDEAPESHRTEANMITFEKQAYNAVYGEDTPPDTRDKGWLFD